MDLQKPIVALFYMDDMTRKAVLSSWQKKKQETIKHPFLDQKIEWGLVPYVLASNSA